jgi:hypothetical protein
MKKKVLGIALVAAIAVAGAWNFVQSQDEVNLSNLALENVEALADPEIIVGAPCIYSYHYCYAYNDEFGYTMIWGYH